MFILSEGSEDTEIIIPSVVLNTTSHHNVSQENIASLGDCGEHFEYFYRREMSNLNEFRFSNIRGNSIEITRSRLIYFT